MAFCTLHFFSEALNREVSVNAFVPQNREGYKTLYLLHGLSDDQTVWQRYTEVELDAAQAGIAVIMPNGDRSVYTDLSSGDRYFTYIYLCLHLFCNIFVARCCNAVETITKNFHTLQSELPLPH